MRWLDGTRLLSYPFRCNAPGQTAVMPGHLVEYNSSTHGQGVATLPRSE